MSGRVGRRARVSQRSRTSRRSPLPSEPSTSTARAPRSSADSGVGACLVETAAPEPVLLQPVEGARQIDDADQRDEVERARGGLGQRRARRRRAVLGDDHRGGAERGGRTQHGADIVRVADLVEHHDQGAAAGYRNSAQDIVEIERIERLDPQRPPLMHRPLGQHFLQRGAVEHLDREVGGEAVPRRSARDAATSAAASSSCPGRTARRRQRRCGLASAAATAWRP